MTTVQTPFPRIYQFELTNFCNAKCSYCPHDKMTRRQSFAPQGLADKVIHYCNVVGQDYIALHHMGEPLCHPDFFSIAQRFKDAGIKIEFSTNGKLLWQNARKIIDLEPDVIRIAVDYFYHDKNYISEIKQFLRQLIKFDKKTVVHIHTITGNDLTPFNDFAHKNIILEHKSFDNWAGEVEGDSTLDKGNECYFLKYNYVVVLCDGRVVPCCMDYNGDYAFTNIDNLFWFVNTEVPLCKNCAKMQFAEGGGWSI